MEEGEPAEDQRNNVDEGKKEETENAVRVSRGLGAILANIAGGNRGNKEDGESKKPPLPKANVPKQQPQENLGFDLNSVEEFSGWGDLSARAGANAEPLNTSRGNDQRMNTSRGNDQRMNTSRGNDQRMNTSRGNDQRMNTSRGNDQRRSRFSREVPRQQPQENLGFDLNSVTEFSGWGDLTSGSGANTEPLNTQRVNNFDRGEGNRRKSTNAGFKRDAPQGQPEDNKRHRQADDKMGKQDLDQYNYSLKEVTSWADMCQYNDDHDSAWFAEENKRLAEEYGGTFISVKYIEGQQGKVGYYCELCQAEMNARKSLELHCGGMKHLKKKNVWEKNKGNPDATEQPEEPRPTRPVHEEPKTRGGGRPGRKPGPPPRGQLLPPPAFGRDKERESRPDRDRPGFKRAEPYGRDHSRFEQSSQGLRNQNDQGGFGRRENQRGDRRPFNNPHNDRRGDTNRPPASRFDHHNPPPFNARAPPPATPAPQENLSGGPTGALVKRLSDCSVKSAEDAKLATEVISLLLKSLKEFQQKKGDANSVLLLQEAEVKFNIMKALQNTTQTGRVNSNPSHVQNESRPTFNPGHVQNESRPTFNPGHVQNESRPTFNPGHVQNESRPTFNPGHVQNEPRPTFNPGHVQDEPRPTFNPGHVQDEPRPPYNQVQRFPAQNFYPPPGAPGYQMGNGQAHYSALPLRYNK